MSMVEKETKVVNENKMMVNMTKEALYDFLLFHAYSKFSGFLVIYWDLQLHLWESSRIQPEE